jgi:hypothetical protein
MSRATPQMRDFAKRLIAHETKGNKSSKPNNSAGFRVCEKLRPALATLMGNAGFRALLSRALALASAEVPILRAVQVQESGALQASEKFKSNESAEADIALVAQLLGLLVAFIGADLTLHFVREVWPKVPLNDLNFDRGGKNEKKK